MKKLTNTLLRINRFLIGIPFKRFESQSASPRLALLSKRGVLEVHGRDSSKLLQGLITNDMTLLSEETCKVIHTYVLNIQGRIIYDLFIHRNQHQSSDGDSYLLECDLDEIENLSTYLKRYKLRSKVKFLPRKELNVYTMFEHGIELPKLQNLDSIYEDPRLSALGARLVTDQNLDNVSEEMKDVNAVSDIDFRIHRFSLGVSEGVDEIANGIPLEHNGALTNSISFQKGCYVGQELVARAHFTGVIRKRVMPLAFECDLSKNNISDVSIYNGKGRKAGKILGHEQNVGVGLVRLKDALDGGNLHLKLHETEVGVVAKRPSWWPESLQY